MRQLESFQLLVQIPIVQELLWVLVLILPEQMIQGANYLSSSERLCSTASSRGVGAGTVGLMHDCIVGSH
jgi:hypothetical protein